MEKKINAIVPMRDGSQRVLKKNTRVIAGKPLYEYLLDKLDNSKYIDKIIITTDIDEVIQKYQGQENFLVLQRPRELQDNCDMNLVLQDCLNKVVGDFFIQLHVTNPLLSVETIDKAIETFFLCPLNDSLLCVSRRNKRFFDSKGRPVNHEIYGEPTTQNLEPFFEDNSTMYVFSRESFSKRNHRIGEKPLFFEIEDDFEALDIDTEEEWKIVEEILKSREKFSKNSVNYS